MSALYSKRKAKPPTELRYDVPLKSRQRIFAVVWHEVDGALEPAFCKALYGLLLREYGELAAPGSEVWEDRSHPVVEHFCYCSDEQALDFIEACFRTNHWVGGQKSVDEINRAFREGGIGYELTAYRGPEMSRGEMRFGPTIPDDQLPQVIRRDHEVLHDEIVKPALQLLSNPKLAVANSEMLKALSDHRAGRDDDAITACNSAFESVLKTICDEKGWAYDADKDACAKLVEICYKEGLFPSFYVDLFKRVGTIRSRLGDAHGRGPVPLHDVEPAHAAHLLHTTCAHIILLCKLAGLE